MSEAIKGSGPDAVAICEALGIDPLTCAGLTIQMRPDALVVVTIERHVCSSEAKAFAKIMERYNLVPAEKKP